MSTNSEPPAGSVRTCLQARSSFAVDYSPLQGAFGSMEGEEGNAGQHDIGSDEERMGRQKIAIDRGQQE